MPDIRIGQYQDALTANRSPATDVGWNGAVTTGGVTPMNRPISWAHV